MERERKAKMPLGVTVRNHATSKTINISFTFKGIQCKEPLRNLPISQSNIKYAERLRGEILNEIERGTFNYADHFPKSTKLKIFGTHKSGVTVLDYLNNYIDLCIKRKLSPSTIDGYKKILTSLKNIHDIYISELSPSIIKQWVEAQETSIKTIRNRYSFLRVALDDAVIDGVIKSNPALSVSVSRYHNTDKQDSNYIVEPFSQTEIDIILSKCSNEQIKNLIGFGFETGMRPSEICSMKWANVNFIKKTYYVNAASVVGIEKGTKTKSGTREIELSDEAIKFISNQKKHSMMVGDYVFLDPKTKNKWSGSDAIRKKAWIPALRLSGINYRNTYQMRHTFATKHISRGANLFWLAKQMGHKGPEMLFRHYGSYLKEYDGNAAISMAK